MAKPRLRLVTPAIVNRTVMPRRRPNAELRRREHLTEAEVETAHGGGKGQPLAAIHRPMKMMLSGR
jgi:hypothetical protein